jgi:hypothetical protein
VQDPSDGITELPKQVVRGFSVTVESISLQSTVFEVPIERVPEEER